ncbi:WD40 repeat-like protein [Aspergillus ibericus CBS 121593]|uniref:WD40 repeat-like protein n=1 Tax=Aspergillus ibericus CBS 121593 TaxID=1448316 RepID=A0A395GVB5_9EURO|nr:WD40 repeat-like protein [Aspergillus ibericus CBS 121593]RAK99445.1 WD40 repeat-like protein [Aspergillus ibericus CBS 121593]
MAEGMRDERGSQSRSTVPAIITTNASSSTIVHHDPSTSATNSPTFFNRGDHSPSTPSPGLLRSSQGFPFGSVSDLASASSGYQQHGRKDSRTLPAASNGSVKNLASSPTLVQSSADSSAIDPLSQHIIKRTNTQKTIPLKLLGRASTEAELGGSDPRGSLDRGSARGETVLHPKPPKEKKKGVSFLSRIIPGKKKDQFLEDDDVSEPETSRMDPDVAAQPIGFVPRFPPPPKYIRVRANYKKEKTFDRVFLAQELDGADDGASVSERDAAISTAGPQNERYTGKAIWALVFSNDGKYLAAAGQDRKVRVWQVVASPEDRDPSQAEGADEAPRLNAQVFKSQPVQVYEGHTGSILDLSWSKNNFLLSSSMDKTVRLWHVSRPECLCCFKHSDFVTSIQFHPRDDRFFLAGSLDTKLRLWSIPDKSVAFVATVPDMITAVAFTPDGRYSISGSLNGLCNIYETDGLKAVGQIHVRSARGRNAKGSKITGIDTMALPHGDPHGDVKLLITSNDSRIRLYNFRDRTLEAKYRGNENSCSQIRASFSNDGKHIICGSEDRRTYVWPVGPMEKDADKRAVEIFDTQSALVTAAIMAPTRAKQVLAFSEDPIFDICNPPPVTLVSQADKENGRTNRNSGASKLAQQSPTYLSRSTHPDGNILIVADYAGKIKVLRQDCAYQKRRYDSWDTHSTISRRILRRTNSARHSIASSIGKDSLNKTPSERIISWRNSVIRHGNRSGMRTPRTRSPSPHKSLRDLPGYSSPGRTPRPDSRSAFTTSPPTSAYKNSLDSQRSSGDTTRNNGHSADPPRGTGSTWFPRGGDKENPLWLQGDQSYAFYNKIAQDAMAVQNRKRTDSNRLLSPHRLSVPGERQLSLGSALSSDYASSNGDGEDGEVLKCDSCRGTNFRATKARNGKQRLVCVRSHLRAAPQTPPSEIPAHHHITTTTYLTSSTFTTYTSYSDNQGLLPPPQRTTKMPYLPTSQSYLEQSSLLLQAYPDTRITTKYTFPHTTPKPTTTPTETTPAAAEAKPPIATLELKTFHPGTGICLKYKTNKGAEVGRLITSLGKLAAGADVEGLGLGNTTLPGAAGAGDVEMGDVSGSGLGTPVGNANAEGEGNGSGNAGAGKGGKGGKKKGGKGKR